MPRRKEMVGGMDAAGAQKGPGGPSNHLSDLAAREKGLGLVGKIAGLLPAKAAAQLAYTSKDVYAATEPVLKAHKVAVWAVLDRIKNFATLHAEGPIKLQGNSEGIEMQVAALVRDKAGGKPVNDRSPPSPLVSFLAACRDPAQGGQGRVPIELEGALVKGSLYDFILTTDLRLSGHVDASILGKLDPTGTSVNTLGLSGLSGLSGSGMELNTLLKSIAENNREHLPLHMKKAADTYIRLKMECLATLRLLTEGPGPGQSSED